MNKPKIPSTPGVYCLWNKITNQIYVGSAQNLSKRIPEHFNSNCHNFYLKRSIKKYGEENFSITYIKTGSDFQKIEQSLINFAFTLEPNLRFNIARKAGGGLLGGSVEGHKALCLKGKSREELRALSLKGKSREELRALCEAGGGYQRVPLFLINTETSLITRIESAYAGGRVELGHRTSIYQRSEINCLNRVKNCLVARSEFEAKLKLEAWLKTPGNDTIDNPIILNLGTGDTQSTLYKLANVKPSSFSSMYNEVINPSSRKPRYFSTQSKADFIWHGTEVKAGSWFRCTKARKESSYDL